MTAALFVSTCGAARRSLRTRSKSWVICLAVSKWKPSRTFSFGYGRVGVLARYAHGVVTVAGAVNGAEEQKYYPDIHAGITPALRIRITNRGGVDALGRARP